MSEIPESVMEEARELAAQIGEDQPVYYEWREWVMVGHMARNSERIASAILAAEKRGEERERERCANVAENLEIVTVEPEYTYTETDDFGDAYTVTVPERRSRRILGGKAIAAAIRKAE